MSRSHSVNSLYQKRQFDMRRFQNNALNEIITKNHSGFTTEDIDDLYMPRQLEYFERKLKASHDLSDNSEQDEIKLRKRTKQRRLVQNDRQSRSSKYSDPKLKRIRTNAAAAAAAADLNGSVVNSRIIINYHTPAKQSAAQPQPTSKTSYLEEAKRKLEEMKSSKAYYYNLNNKLKSSVSNLVRASHDLARNSELRNRFLLNRNFSLHELYDVRRDQIRYNQTGGAGAAPVGQMTNSSYTSDDIDDVYMPWMMENYGRKLAIEALKRRGNMPESQQSPKKPTKRANQRTKSPYVSQYYAQTLDKQTVRRNDLWEIDRGIRRYLKKSRLQHQQQQQQQVPSTMTDSQMDDSEVSITDSDTSSDDTRPIVPEKINKPDVSLKNKILKTINKSLLSTELTGIDLNLLKLKDYTRKITKRIEKRALERELEHDLIRSFSCGHLFDVRREDLRHTNMRINKHSAGQRTGVLSYTTEDVVDLYMPKMLEAYKLKMAIERERRFPTMSEVSLSNRTSSVQTPAARHSPMNQSNAELNVPVEQIKSPSGKLIKSPLSGASSAYRNNPNMLFTQIVQERLHDIDQKMANEISGSSKNVMKRKVPLTGGQPLDEESEDTSTDDAASTDRDQDDSLAPSSESDDDDLKMNDDDMNLFESHTWVIFIQN